jgi:nucleoid-associated protein YgaU
VSNLVGSVVQAAPSQLLGVLAPVQAAQAQVTNLAAGLNAQIDDGADFGGVTAGDDPMAIISAFTATAAAAQAMPNVYAAGSLLGRIATNLGAVGVSGRQTTQAGGDLYSLATQAYGDPSGWTTIAEANGITDPVLTGVNTLRIPPVIDGSDGVLAA